MAFRSININYFRTLICKYRVSPMMGKNQIPNLSSIPLVKGSSKQFLFFAQAFLEGSPLSFAFASELNIFITSDNGDLLTMRF